MFPQNTHFKWYKRSPLVQNGNVCKEIWIREENDVMEEFDIELTFGKKTDLLSLKKDIISSLSKKMKYVRESRSNLYSQNDLEIVTFCPVCNNSSQNAQDKVQIYGAQYVQCPFCSHIYLKERPDEKSLSNFYLKNNIYASTYTDKETAEFRLKTINTILLSYLIDIFKKTYGCKPKKILDVGAGGGHFVEACRRMGIEAAGIELSESSRNFSKEVWGIELDNRDYFEIANEYNGYDVITFWGLLEHIPNPNQFLSVAYNIVSKSQNGMIISRTPRWNALSTNIQILNPDTVLRHLDPLGHIMIFTDASIAELYYRNKIIPISGWYYGMDVYETLMQIAYKIGNNRILYETRDLQIDLQQSLDENRFSDLLILSGIPKK